MCVQIPLRLTDQAALTAGAIPVGDDASDPAVPTATPGSVAVPGGVKAHGTANYVTGGRLRPKNGSGTMMAMPMYAEIDSGVQTV